jgi:hypothetical protein
MAQSEPFSMHALLVNDELVAQTASGRATRALVDSQVDMPYGVCRGRTRPIRACPAFDKNRLARGALAGSAPRAE